jgi:hypothetical protein
MHIGEEGVENLLVNKKLFEKIQIGKDTFS